MTKIAQNSWASVLTFAEQREFVRNEAAQDEAVWLLRRLADAVLRAEVALQKQIQRRARVPG